MDKRYEHPLYKTWSSMKTRCYNKNSSNYKYYGQRGISICDRWLESFENFVIDMGDRSTGLTLDRIDVNGNYEPTNCRWATKFEQVHNRNPYKRGVLRGCPDEEAKEIYSKYKKYKRGSTVQCPSCKEFFYKSIWNKSFCSPQHADNYYYATVKRYN